jgi:hypothetical protein
MDKALTCGGRTVQWGLSIIMEFKDLKRVRFE